MRGHAVLSLKQMAGNSCKVTENVLCPAVIMSPVMMTLAWQLKKKMPNCHIKITVKCTTNLQFDKLSEAHAKLLVEMVLLC